jgi:hypothetical protein
LPGVKFSSTTWYTLNASPSGNYWLLDGYADVTSDRNEVFILGSGTTGSLLVQEGTPTAWNASVNYQAMDDLTDLTDAGDVIISGDTDEATSADDFIAYFPNGGVGQLIAKEGGDASAILGAGVTWDTLDSPQISNAGRMGWRASSIDGLPGGTANDAMILFDNAIVAQKGITVPGNQTGGTTRAWQNFDLYDWRMDGTGTQSVILGDLDGGTSDDDVLVVNGNVVVQEDGLADASFTSPIKTIAPTIGLGMNGTNWLVRGSNDDNEDWVVGDVGNGQELLAATGSPIFPGSSENFDDTPYNACFFMNIANSVGDYIIGGLTDIGDEFVDAVLVLNGEEVVLRQGDAIDLDGNGLLDDGVFINTFRNDDAFLTDDLQLTVLVSLMDALHESAGQAMITYAVPEPTALSLLLIGGLALLRRR